jgi:sugar lactone lactonase YvrE
MTWRLFFSALLFARVASANGGGSDWDEEGGLTPPPPFALTSPAIGDVHAAKPAPAHLTSSRIVALGGGAEALVVDADSGKLIRTDRAGAKVDELDIGRDAGLLAFDAPKHRAYVADRAGDRIVVVDTTEKLRVHETWKTPVEPYAIALTPDRSTLLVTVIADRALVAFDAATGRETWRVTTSLEPRGIAVSADGSHAIITSLVSGGVDDVSLASHRLRSRALPALDDGDHARAAFAATFVGDNAVIPFQIHTPVAHEPSGDHYGGGALPPIGHHLAFLGVDGRRAVAVTNVHEPRAIAWDGIRDRLYVAGLASDNVVEVVRASQLDAAAGTERTINGRRCGADGIAIATDGTVVTWCSFTRSLAWFAPRKEKVQRGPELAASSLDEQRHAGLVLFHSANEHISSFGALSCGNCHLDGRADGLSWRIVDKELQTPLLAGRINADTAPFKWDGGAHDLPRSLRETTNRLGGSGLSKRDLAAVAAFVEGIPGVRAPTPTNAIAVARGKALFESSEVGCTNCHDGRMYTDASQHDLAGRFDTPSLVGLAASAPYFHDGSAPNLENVLRDRGRVHGMADAATRLGAQDVAALVAFLETL